MADDKMRKSAFYDYYTDRHGVEPDDKGADRESRLDFNAGWQACECSRGQVPVTGTEDGYESWAKHQKEPIDPKAAYCAGAMGERWRKAATDQPEFVPILKGTFDGSD